MIDGKSLSVQSYVKNNLIPNVFEYRESGAQNRLAYYLTQGYDIIDGPTSGTIDLTSLAPGKYVVVWRIGSTPTGTLTATVADTMTGTTGLHEAVAVMGVILDPFNNISSHNISIDLNFPNVSDLFGGLEFAYAGVDIVGTSGSGAAEVDFYYCTIHVVTHPFGFANGKYYSCHWQTDSSGADDITITRTDAMGDPSRWLFDNNIIEEIGTGSDLQISVNGAASGTMVISNSRFFSDSGSTKATFDGNTDGIINFQNVLFNNITFGFTNGAKTNDGSVIYYRKSLYYASSTVTSNYVYLPATRNQIFERGFPKLDTSIIDWNGFVNLDGEWNIEKTVRVLAYSTIRGVKYQFRFWEQGNSAMMVPDTLKSKLSESFLLVVRREDIEAELADDGITQILKNEFYDGSDYVVKHFDENFFILTEDAGATQHVYAYYVDSVHETLLSEFVGTACDILKVFQIMEITETQNLANLWPDVTNGPMRGELILTDLTRRYVR